MSPVSALSLVGFLGEQEALAYLTSQCVPPDSSPEAFQRLWNEAKDRLGPPVERAGLPEITEPPEPLRARFEAAQQNPRFSDTVNGALGWAFKMVEVRPLLAFQLHVETTRSADLCRGVSGTPTVEEMLEICLPTTVEEIPHHIVVQQAQPGGVWVRSRRLNLRTLGFGYYGKGENEAHFVGLMFGTSSPLVQVVRFNGQCYLRNGYHRVFGLGKAGATHVPCLVLDTDKWEYLGAPGGGAGLTQSILQSGNPPTCAHFIDDRATAVNMKAQTRVIHLTWSEVAVPDEG